MRTEALEDALKDLYENDAEDGAGLQALRWEAFDRLRALPDPERQALASRVAEGFPGEEDFQDWLGGAL